MHLRGDFHRPDRFSKSDQWFISCDKIVRGKCGHIWWKMALGKFGDTSIKTSLVSLAKSFLILFISSYLAIPIAENMVMIYECEGFFSKKSWIEGWFHASKKRIRFENIPRRRHSHLIPPILKGRYTSHTRVSPFENGRTEKIMSSEWFPPMNDLNKIFFLCVWFWYDFVQHLPNIFSYLSGIILFSHLVI